VLRIPSVHHFENPLSIPAFVPESWKASETQGVKSPNSMKRATEFIQNLKPFLPKADLSQLKDLRKVLKIARKEFSPSLRKACLKEGGYWNRLFSSESWSEWTEHRTAIGRVVSLYADFIENQVPIESFTQRLSGEVLKKANEEAKNYLDQRALSKERVLVKQSPSAFPPIIDLSTLDGIKGSILRREWDVPDYRASLNRLGDVNGDGIEDIAIGVPYLNTVYVLFGKEGVWSSSINLFNLDGINGFIINGNNSDQFGASVSRVGDFNGDGIEDFSVGAPGGNPNGKTGAGRSFLFFGKKEDWESPVSAGCLNGTNGIVFNGEVAGDKSGTAVGGRGSINGDFYGDLLIGAPGATRNGGRAYAVFGNKGPWTSPFELSNLNGTNGVIFTNSMGSDDQTGTSVLIAPDLNGDNIDDVVVGSPGYADEFGYVSVLFGRKGGWLSPFEISMVYGKFNGTGFIAYSCYSPCGGFGFCSNGGGWSVSSGDVNGDRRADLIIGAPFTFSSQSEQYYAGRTYVLFSHNGTWPDTVDLTELNGLNGGLVLRGKEGDSTGYSVGGGGDINGDGIEDVIIGAPAGTESMTSQGLGYLFLGKREEWSSPVSLSKVNGIDGFALTGGYGSFRVGTSVAIIGDVNNDGIADFALTEGNAYDSWIIFGDVAPTLLVNQMEIQRNQTVLVTSANLNATDRNHPMNDLTFVITGLEHGRFLDDRKKTIYNFSQPQILGRRVWLEHDGSRHPPAYNVSVKSSGFAFALPAPARVNFTLLDAPPILMNGGDCVVEYEEGSSPVLLDTTVTVTDRYEDPIANATISITGNFFDNEDSLSFVDQLNINGQYNGGRLLLKGSASLADYTKALRNVTYLNLLHSPTLGVRTISLTVYNGLQNSNTLNCAVNVVSSHESSRWVEIAIVGGGVIATLGICLIGLKRHFSKTAKKRFETALHGVSTSANGLETEAKQTIFRAVAEKIFQQVKHTSFLGYISEQSMDDYVNAILRIVLELRQRGLMIEAMQDRELSEFIEEIARQTRYLALPKTISGLRICLNSLFCAEASPRDIRTKADEIAEAVQRSWNLRNVPGSRQRIPSKADAMTPLLAVLEQ
jgi:hypothetical protein